MLAEEIAQLDAEVKEILDNPNDKSAFFETLYEKIGQTIDHGSVTITNSDLLIPQHYFGSQYAPINNLLAKALGFFKGPFLDDMNLFNIVFSKTVKDISLRSKANLGYDNVAWGTTVQVGDKLDVQSKVIGGKRNAKGKDGVIYVRTTARNQEGDEVLSYTRWVMVPTLNPGAPLELEIKPDLTPDPDSVNYNTLYHSAAISAFFSAQNSRTGLTTNSVGYEDLNVGDVIVHSSSIFVNDTMHMGATQEWGNPARVHFDLRYAQKVRPDAPSTLVYGGVALQILRQLGLKGFTTEGKPSGLMNAFRMLKMHRAKHENPLFAEEGKKLFAISRVVSKAPMGGDWAAVTVEGFVYSGEEPLTDIPVRDGKGSLPPNFHLSALQTFLLPKLASLRAGPK